MWGIVVKPRNPVGLLADRRLTGDTYSIGKITISASRANNGTGMSRTSRQKRVVQPERVRGMLPAGLFCLADPLTNNILSYTDPHASVLAIFEGLCDSTDRGARRSVDGLPRWLCKHLKLRLLRPRQSRTSSVILCRSKSSYLTKGLRHSTRNAMPTLLQSSSRCSHTCRVIR
jgi:hypothetical protein